ncbi:MAG: succinyldiaminopimelate transaminase [Gammaproteobacteria bacterium]|nr:succinyldiaminopimelate transaminase [Gammaproteobacteria bacterium]
MNPDLSLLQPYPFEKLARLKAGITPPAGRSPINLSIGEPKHPTPAFINEALLAHLHTLGSYPTTRGMPELRQAIAGWLTRRFALPSGAVDPETQILPVNGSREALFAFAQCVVDRRPLHPVVAMPNPFYQIYEGAALLAGAAPYFINATADSGQVPDFASVPDAVWQRCQLLYLCTPGNPSGAVLDAATLQRLINLAEQHDFIIASDECYSEIYFDEQQPPPGLLQVAHQIGNTEFRRCVVFHSLSKRSNVPGMRSGFVAGDAAIIEDFYRYRTYHGCAMAPAIQAASIAAWNDEQHVIDNRRIYRQKFVQVLEILEPALPVEVPPAAFYLWPQLPVDDTVFARRLYAEQHVTVLPGSYLSRPAHGCNPGARHVRIALVAPLDECIDAARRIRHVVESL